LVISRRSPSIVGVTGLSSAPISSTGRFSDAVRAVAGLALFETGVHGRLAAADRVIALVLGHGMAIYQADDVLSIFYNLKISFPAVSLPGLRLSPCAHPKPMIHRGFFFNLPLDKIFSLSFPVRQGNGCAALPASEALSRRRWRQRHCCPRSRDARRGAPSGKSPRVVERALLPKTGHFGAPKKKFHCKAGKKQGPARGMFSDRGR
jgi:hypothetical protein